MFKATLLLLPYPALAFHASSSLYPSRASPSILRRYATTEETTGQLFELKARSLSALIRDRVNLKPLEAYQERMFPISVDKAAAKAKAAELTRQVQAIEQAILEKISEEDPYPELGQGSLARLKANLPGSRVILSGAAGSLAALIYGKAQRCTGTGATNNVGLKHPNVLCTGENDKGKLNAQMSGRFSGAGCWHEHTQVGGKAYDEGLPGIMSDVVGALAGDERPFMLVPRDGADIVVLGSRYLMEGTWMWGWSTGLDLSQDAPIPDLGPLSDKSKPVPLAHYQVFEALVDAAAVGLRPRARESFGEDFIADQHTLSSIRGPVEHLVALIHPLDMPDFEAKHLPKLQGAGVPFTCFVPGPGCAYSTASQWVTGMERKAGAPGRPAGELLAPVRVAIESPGDWQAAGLTAGGSGGDGTISQESLAELVVQSVLLLDPCKSRVVTLSAGCDAPGVVIPAGVATSEELLKYFRSAEK